VIDWSLKGESIFARKRPLSPNTLARIYTGLQKFSGLPFIVPQQQGGAPVKDINDPLSTITTTSRGIGLCEPFLVVMKGQSTAQSIDRPVPSITQVPYLGVAEPFLVDFYGERKGQKPRCRSVDKPLGTVTSQGRLGLCEPFLVEYHGNHIGKEDGDRRVKSVDQPIPTLDTSNRYALAEPFLVKYYGTGAAKSVDEPLDTVTGKDRFGLVLPEMNAKLDIRFRMLQPHELAAAMSFPSDYKFAGSKEAQVMQIGNAVDVNQSKALCLAILRGV
jgi:DNA (cytosine-5)-methyltransferase 1